MPLAILDLRYDRTLLDPNFEGYKLCLDKIPIHSIELSSPVFVALPATDQYSYLNAKLFSTHNHVIGDSFETSMPAIYFINRLLEVKKAYIDNLTNEINEIKVWVVPNSCNRTDGDYNFSLCFASEHLAVLSDGAGYLYLLDTGSRSNDDFWQCIYSDEIIGPSKHFIVQDVFYADAFIHCLLYCVDQDLSAKKAVGILNWITLSKANDNTWGSVALRELKCNGDIFYSHLEPNCEAVYCVSTSPCKFTIDSENPIPSCTDVRPSKYFQWMQTFDSIKLKFNLPDIYVRDNIRVNIEQDRIEISYQDEIYLQGSLVYEADIQQSTWTVTTDILEIFLRKKTVGTTWPEVIIGDNNGKYISTRNFQSRDEINEDVTNEVEGSTIASEFGSSFSNQQIEECDFEDEDKMITFERLCVKTHESTHRANFGVNSVLFSIKRTENLAPTMVIRNDVDGCLWQPVGTDASFNLKHEATLLAFGYIQASKQQKKFLSCAPDLSYSVICESRRHIFIYYQNKPINNAELRNRTSGRRFGTVAQQHVISISNEEILGLYAANSLLFLLTENSIIILKL